MNNIKSEVVSSFTRNGKMYLILELSVPQNQVDQSQPENFVTDFIKDVGNQLSGLERQFDWVPDWNDFKVDLTYTDGKVCMVISYKDKKWEHCITILEGCYQPADIDLFSVGPVDIYLRYVNICPIEKGVNVSFQCWAKMGPAKMKIAPFSQDIKA